MLKRGLIGYLPVNIVQAICGFGAIVVFTRLLSADDYGAYALGFSVMSLVHTCLFSWIEASMARFYAAEAEGPERADLFATLYRSYAVMALALPVVAGFILLALPVSTGLKLALAAGLGSILSRSLLKLAQERRRSAGAVGGYAWIDMALNAGGFALGAVFAVLGWGGAGPLAGAGIAAAVLLVFALPTELGFARGGRFERARLTSYLGYGLPISLSLVMGLALATTDRFVLAGYLDEAAVGAYHAGYSLSNRTLDVLFIWLGMAGGPAAIAALERGGIEALNRTVLDQAKLMALIAIPAAAGLALVAQPLVHLMVGPGLAGEAAQVTPWIALGALFAGTTTYYFHTAFTLGRRTKLLLVAMAIPAAANLILVLALVPRFGLRGAMWATAGSYGLGLLASCLIGRRAIRLPIPWATLGRVLAATAVMAVAVMAVPPLGGVVELAMKAGIGAGVYALAVLVLDAGGARSRAGEALDVLRARTLRSGSPA
jgi:O-antigen/teichoic acid export membrane protein